MNDSQYPTTNISTEEVSLNKDRYVKSFNINRLSKFSGK